MADAVQATAAAPAKAAAAPVVRYTVDELKAAAKKQFGCGPEVIDGAIYGKNAEAYSVDEMKALIDAFLKRPAVEGNGEA